MRGILFRGPRQIELLDDLPTPEPGPGQVVVHNTHLGLCGSNTGPYTGEGRWGRTAWPAPVGWMGHENVGFVSASRDPRWPEGTPVLAQAANYNGYVEAMIAHPDSLARLPEATRDLGPFVVAQPLATVLRAFSKTESVINLRCGVVGQGPIGLLFTYLLRRFGARQIIAIDRIPWRLDWSRRMGATDVIDASSRDVPAAVRELTDGAMLGFCAEAATTPEALATAASLLAPEGRLCPFGVPRHDDQAFPWVLALNNELRIVLSHGSGCMQFFQQAVDRVAGDDALLTGLVTPRLPFARAAQAFEMYADPLAHPGSLKLILEL